MIESIEVKSLSEYVNMLQKYSSEEYFYRGENNNFEERQAGGFRDFDGEWKSNYKDYMVYVDKYYTEIGHRLNDIERENFIAFAQHHGIPTNLIDITTAPLVALYFACNKAKSNVGYIYLFDKKYINVTNIFTAFPRKNLIDLICSKEDVVIKILLRELEVFKFKYEAEFDNLLKILINELEHYIGWDDFDFEGFDNLPTRDFSYFLAKEICDRTDIDFIAKYSEDFDLDEVSYLCIACYLFTNVDIMRNYFYWINFLPNLIYKPVLKFERARLQSGEFLVQANMFYEEEVYDTQMLPRQRIVYKEKITIKNTKKFLKELDNIGINKATIFGDFDSIASYIVNKY